MTNLIETLRALPPDTLGLTARLGALAPESSRDERDVLSILALLGCQAENLLPEIVRLFGDAFAPHECDYGQQLLHTFLYALPAHPTRWTAEDGWVAVLRSKPAAEFDWLVYADWLDDRDDPRGEYVRLRHATASGHVDLAEAESLAARRVNRLDNYGHGWERVYDAIETPPI